MSWLSNLLALVAERPLLARLLVASVELLASSLLLAALLSIWRPSSRRFAALLWLAVLAKPVLSLAIGSPLALVRFHAEPPARVASPSTSPGASSDAGAAPAHDATPATSSDISEGSAAPLPRGDAARTSFGAVARSLEPAQWILGAWLLGVVSIVARRLVLRRRRIGLVAAAASAPPWFTRRHEELARAAGMQRIPALRVSETLESPALAGIVRPIVLLPRWMVERGLDGTVEAALRHELAHCRYCDPLALLVRDAASTLFFFHPAAWFAGRRLVDALELACDRDCLRDAADAPGYAENLYEILRRIRARRAASFTSGMLGLATPGRTARRIAALLDGTSMRPLTRGAAAAAALVAAVLLTTGVTLAPAEPQESAPSQKAAGAPKRREKPDVFLLGSLDGDKFMAFGAATSDRIANLWGRPQELKVYEDLFDNAAHPFDLKPGDVLVLLLTPERDTLVPEKYRDLLPEPWAKIEATLKGGGTVELEHESHGLDVVVLGAKDQSALEKLLATTGKLASLRDSFAPPAGQLRRDKPSVFLLGASGSAFKTFSEGSRGRISSLWGRSNELKIYEDLFDNPAHPFKLKPGDLLVLLLTPDHDSVVPEKYRDLLPEPWAKVEATLKSGGTIELEHGSHGLDVVILGAKDQSALEHLLATTEKLASLRNGEATHDATHDAIAGATKLPSGTRYVVTFDANDRRTASVHLELHGADSAIRLSMSSGARHLEGGYSHFLGGLKATDAAGKTIAATTAVDHDHFSATIDRPATIDYHVALQHDASPWPEGGPDEAPYATDHDVFWTGRALFLGADFEGAEVEIRLPENWHVSVPWDPVAGRPNTFRVGSFAELTESFLLAGSHEPLKAQSGETQVAIAVGRELGQSAELLRDGVQRLLDRGAALFGGTPPGRKLLVANRGSWSGFNGGVFGQSISLLSDRGFDAADTARWFPFVAHEIVHLWNGGGGLRSRDHDYWFSEGFTEYYAWVLSARLGIVDRDGFLERVRSACRAYFPQAGSASLHEAESRALQYDGGFLAALALDVHLRRKDPKSHGLDDLMREMFRRHGATGKPYSSADVAAVASALAGDDLDRLFARCVDGKESLPIEKELAPAGLELHVDTKATLLSRDYVIHDVLRIRSLTQSDSGLLVRKSAEAGYQDGDLLIEIDGTPVRTFGDLQRVLVGKEPGHEVTLKLRRGERDESLALKAGGHNDPPMEHAVDVRLALKPGADATLLDRVLAR